MSEGNSNTPVTTPVVPLTDSSTIVPAPGPAVAPVSIPPASSVIQAQSPGETLDWQRRHDSVRGNWMAERSHWDTQRGFMEQQIRGLEAQVTAVQTQNQQLATERETLTEQVASLPDLQQQAAQAEELLNRSAKLEAFMRYPQLVGQTQVSTTTETNEAGEEVEVQRRVNPILDLVLSSTLGGQAYVDMLNDLAARFDVPRGTVVEPPPPPPPAGTPLDMTTTVPQTPQPAGPTSLEELRRRRDEARDDGDYETFFQLQDAIGDELLKQQQ